MQILFLGVGEACDEREGNTALLVRSSPQSPAGLALLDCGFTAAHRFFAFCADRDALELVWLSHFHGDHFFGLPLLLLRLWEEGRRRPLVVCGPPGVERVVPQAFELAYPGLLPRLGFPLQLTPIPDGGAMCLAGFTLATAASEHSAMNLALRLDDGHQAIYYSGDGRPNAACLALARGCQLIVHEAFALQDPPAGHGSVTGALDFARQAGARICALVHLARHSRRQRHALTALTTSTGDLAVLLPATNDLLTLPGGFLRSAEPCC
ncbi:MAG: MBL fold metallo-hydrolase [Thermodesulfobacteriota bacterium]